jgi:hypothetical protein
LPTRVTIASIFRLHRVATLPTTRVRRRVFGQFGETHRARGLTNSEEDSVGVCSVQRGLNPSRLFGSIGEHRQSIRPVFEVPLVRLDNQQSRQSKMSRLSLHGVNPDRGPHSQNFRRRSQPPRPMPSDRTHHDSDQRRSPGWLHSHERASPSLPVIGHLGAIEPPGETQREPPPLGHVSPVSHPAGCCISE